MLKIVFFFDGMKIFISGNPIPEPNKVFFVKMTMKSREIHRFYFLIRSTIEFYIGYKNKIDVFRVIPCPN